jgi:hypothetical protein
MEKKKKGRPRKNKETIAPLKVKKLVKIKKQKSAPAKALSEPSSLRKAIKVTPIAEVKVKKTGTAKRTTDGAVVIEADKDDSEKSTGKHIVIRGGQAVLVDDSDNPEID